MNKERCIVHGAAVVFIGILSAVVTQQVDEGNYIVPRATLVLSRNTNKSAAGQKRKCESNFDCKGFINSHCCKTISGFSKCRKKCRENYRLYPTLDKERGRKKHKKNRGRLRGCDVGDNKVYKEGEIMSTKDGCNKCMCNKGRLLCTKKKCPPAKCKYKGDLYEEGYHLVLHNGCKRCECQHGGWNCTSHPCTVSKDLKTGNSVATNVVPSLLPALVSIIVSVYLFLLL